MNSGFIPYQSIRYTADKTLVKADDFYALMDYRRSVREFSSRSVPMELIEQIIRTAGTAPSGANKQPWSFCVIQDPHIKSQIREAAENEEQENYNGRMSPEWLEDLAILGTDWQKPFLETAPFLIAVFRRTNEIINNKKRKNYYVQESVGIACGILIAAIHNAGLVCLTHTPSPMNFLQQILNRPENEKPYLLIPVGYPADEVFVPAIHRKPLEEIMFVY